jgi:hypothetical protein
MPRPPSQAGPFRRAFHSIVALAGWVLFLWWWWLVLQRVGRDEVRYTVLFIVWTLVVCVGLTAVWAYHNLRIFRRRGPRMKVRTPIESFTHDRLGRTVDFATPIEGLRLERQVWIEVDSDRKRYRNSADVEPGRNGDTLRADGPVGRTLATPLVRDVKDTDVGR